MVRRLFVRAALPVGIVFLSCFSLLDHLVQVQLRAHRRQELIARDRLTGRELANDEALVRRSIGTLAEAAGLPRAVQDGPASQLTLRLEQLAALLDEDFYAVAGSDHRPLAALRRDDHRFATVASGSWPEGARLAAMADGYYLLSTHPLRHDGRTVGWLTTGRHWVREMPVADSLYALARNGTVLAVAGTKNMTALAAGARLPVCPGGASDCEAVIDGRRHVVLHSSIAPESSGIGVYLVDPADMAGNPILAITRTLMAAGALLSILGAWGIAILTGRSVARPLRAMTEACARAKESGQLPEIEIAASPIAEVDALAKTLRGAIRSVEEGQGKLTQAYFQFMGAIVAMLDARDRYTAGHSHRVSAYSEALARDFGLPQDQIEDIRVGALLHDIGKVGVPDEVLRKHDRLTPGEYELMKQHPTIGRKVLEQVSQFEKYLDVVEFHHENLDGTGYPKGLRGEQIPIAARIVKVADVYDALSTDRPYRKSMTPDEVQDILRKGSGTHFDRLLVEVFLTRSVPRFEARGGLANLHRAVGASTGTPVAQKAANV